MKSSVRVYFCEFAPSRAAEWALEKYGKEATVLRATIRLDDCLLFGPFCERLEKLGIPLPSQTGKIHGLDRAVINFFAEEEGPPVRVVRAPFIEGRRLWNGSDLWDKAHIQIAVRDVELLSNIVLVEDAEREEF